MQTLTYQEQAMQAIEKMSLPELEQFIAQVLVVSAQRRAPLLTRTESELLLKINRGLSKEIQQRCNLLNTKRRAGTLNPDEHAELLQLNEQIENLEAKRVSDLAELAQLRKTTVPRLMLDLGIKAPAYAPALLPVNDEPSPHGQRDAVNIVEAKPFMAYNHSQQNILSHSTRVAQPRLIT